MAKSKKQSNRQNAGKNAPKSRARAVHAAKSPKIRKVKPAALKGRKQPAKAAARTRSSSAKKRNAKNRRPVASKLVKITGVLLITAGILLIIPPLYYAIRDHNIRSQAVEIPETPVIQLPQKPSLVSGKPSQLSIPSLKMEIEVVDGAYNKKTKSWTLSLNKAHYALPSVMPNNEEGDTLIYGHYRPEVFARLHNIKAGSEAVVTTANGYKFHYIFEETKSTSPTDTSIFAYKGKPMLTLQTCSGAFFQNRQLFSFRLDRFEKV